MKQERIGTIIALIQAALWGFFPIISHLGSQVVQPLTFAALSSLMGALTLFCFLIFQKKLHELRKKEYRLIVLIILLDICIPFTLFFVGAKITSSLNTSILLLSEIIFTLIFTPFIGEKNTLSKLLGAGSIFCGAFLIMFKGSLAFNVGDLLIMLSTFTFPIGNYYSKKALNVFSPETILFSSLFGGGVFLLLIATWIEPVIKWGEIFQNHWYIIFLNGFLLLGLGKALWLQSFKRLDISKAITLGFTFPFFSMMILTIFFQETFLWYQLIGIPLMILGITLTIWRKSVPQNLTKYALKEKIGE